MMSRLFKAIILGLIIAIIGLLISPFRLTLDIEENIGLGLLFKLRGVRPAPSDVVVVSIEKESSENLGLPNNPDKWPRSLHARLIENLVGAGAGVISFDLHFIESRSAEDDRLFAQAIKKAGNVVLAEPLVAKEVPLSDKGASANDVHRIVKTVKPIAPFSSSAVATAPFPLPRIPFKVNRYWTFQTGAGDSPTLSVVAYQFFTLPVYHAFIQLMEKVSPHHAAKLPANSDTAMKTRGLKELIRDVREIFQGEPSIAEKMLAELAQSETSTYDGRTHRLLESLIKIYGSAGSRYINYYGPPRTITTIPYHQALQLNEGTAGKNRIDLRGKAVFVGLSEILLADRKDSFYTVFSQANGIFISGVEIAATAFSNILEDTHVKPISLHLHMLILLLWGIVAGMICRVSSIKVGALGVVGFSILYLIAAAALFKASNTWYPIVVPLFVQAPLAFMGAVAIEHSRLFKETLIKLRMEKDLSRARDVQMSMFPDTCPQVEGFHIAASSIPVREVGGDFYDCITMGEGKAGLVIGDVTGKSVSGALVMSASRSVFRMLSEEDLSVRERMMRANRRLKEDVKADMFVALIFAVLNSANRTLTLCSAGQTQPIHYSTKTGKARLIKTEGDTIPLGIYEKANYQETQIPLSPGDRLLFYTDGIVEAMNAKKEIFGFERLIDVVQESKSLDADSLLQVVLTRVNEFTGKASQHDDLTLIVVSVE